MVTVFWDVASCPCCLHHPGDDGDYTHLWNVGKLIPDMFIKKFMYGIVSRKLNGWNQLPRERDTVKVRERSAPAHSLTTVAINHKYSIISRFRLINRHLFFCFKVCVSLEKCNYWLLYERERVSKWVKLLLSVRQEWCFRNWEYDVPSLAQTVRHVTSVTHCFRARCKHEVPQHRLQEYKLHMHTDFKASSVDLSLALKWMCFVNDLSKGILFTRNAVVSWVDCIGVTRRSPQPAAEDWPFNLSRWDGTSARLETCYPGKIHCYALTSGPQT